jgi:hypothetical protein
MDAKPRLLLPVLPVLPLLLLLPPLPLLPALLLTVLPLAALRLSDFVYWLWPSGLLFGTIDLLLLDGHGVLAEVRRPWTSDRCAIAMPCGLWPCARCFCFAHAV